MEQPYTTDKLFDAINFKEQPLATGEYENCQFKNCDFSSTSLSACKFIDCEFSGCDLSLAKLDQTVFRDVSF